MCCFGPDKPSLSEHCPAADTVSAVFCSCSYLSERTQPGVRLLTCFQSLQSLVHFPCASERIFHCVHCMRRAVFLWLIESVNSGFKTCPFLLK